MKVIGFRSGKPQFNHRDYFSDEDSQGSKDLGRDLQFKTSFLGVGESGSQAREWGAGRRVI